MMRIESSWSGLPQAPNIIVPRQRFDTWTPVRPRVRYSMVVSLTLSVTSGGASGLRDLAAERLQGDRVGLGTAAATGVQAVDRGHLVGGQLEVEHVDVLGDAAGLGGLGNDRAAVLQTPAQHHLGQGLPVRAGDVCDDRVLGGAAMAAVTVEGDPADR